MPRPQAGPREARALGWYPAPRSQAPPAPAAPGSSPSWSLPGWRVPRREKGAARRGQGTDQPAGLPGREKYGSSALFPAALRLPARPRPRGPASDLSPFTCTCDPSPSRWGGGSPQAGRRTRGVGPPQGTCGSGLCAPSQRRGSHGSADVSPLPQEQGCVPRRPEPQTGSHTPLFFFSGCTVVCEILAPHQGSNLGLQQ